MQIDILKKEINTLNEKLASDQQDKAGYKALLDKNAELDFHATRISQENGRIAEDNHRISEENHRLSLENARISDELVNLSNQLQGVQSVNDELHNEITRLTIELEARHGISFIIR